MLVDSFRGLHSQPRRRLGKHSKERLNHFIAQHDQRRYGSEALRNAFISASADFPKYLFFREASSSRTLRVASCSPTWLDHS